jgi:hypothetical protein
MPEPVTITVTALAGTGLGIVVANKLFDLLLTKWRSGGAGVSFTANDQRTLQALGNAHLVNAKDSKGRFFWWGMETTDAIRENTEVQREILAELKKQNGSRLP